MVRAINFINLLGWMALLLLSGWHVFSAAITRYDVLYTTVHPIHKLDISLEVLILQAIQTFQIVDVLLILLGKSKGSLLGAIAQITGRLIVTWGFVSADTNRISFFLMVIMWSIADSNRYMYYLFKSDLTAGLRYNLFLVLYPAGVTGEMMVINDYIKRNVNDLSISDIATIRYIQIGIVVGMVMLYFYMLSMRRKFYRKPKQELEMPEDKKGARKNIKRD